MIKAIPGEIGHSAEVVALPGSKVGADSFTAFRVTFKTNPDEHATEGSTSEETFKNEIRRGLASVLQKGPIEIRTQPDPTSNIVAGTLYFEDRHDAPDVIARLADAKLTDAKAELRSGRTDVLEFSGVAPAGMSDGELRTLIKSAFVGHEDSAGRNFKFAEPIPEASVIGRRVVGELRDSALKALLLSMLLTVIYMRVRFAEYSYGFASVIALVHDIFITLGAIAFLVLVPFIHVEFDMTTIAVFLTIVGYSSNDTIIVFDRIRENLPRMKGTLWQVVNASINQTFSRTVMTASTACMAMLIVLIFNFGSGNVLEGFAFTMFFGIATGTFLVDLHRFAGPDLARDARATQARAGEQDQAPGPRQGHLLSERTPCAS
jgi:preprotein translocase SecF subunit